jgi:hypothetical protein
LHQANFTAKKSDRSRIIAGLFWHVFKELWQALCRDSLHPGCGTWKFEAGPVQVYI